MTENNNTPPVLQPSPVHSLNPGDTFIALVVPAGKEELMILSDGKSNELEYALMLIAGLNALVTQIVQKSASPIVGLNGRHILKG